MQNKKTTKKPRRQDDAVRAGAKGSEAGAAELIVARKLFYKDSARNSILLVSLGVGALLLSCGVMYSAITTQADNVYIAVNPDNTVTNLIKLAEPNMSDAAISSWTAKALIDTFDFNYTNISPSIARAIAHSYTDAGGAELLSGLESTGNWSAVLDRKLIVSLALKDTPLVVKKGRSTATNSYMWRLEAKGILTYRNQTQVFTNNVLFTLTLARRSQRETPDGVGIARIVMEIIK